MDKQTNSLHNKMVHLLMKTNLQIAKQETIQDYTLKRI